MEMVFSLLANETFPVQRIGLSILKTVSAHGVPPSYMHTVKRDQDVESGGLPPTRRSILGQSDITPSKDNSKSKERKYF
jgi:hypothetical protein